MVEASESEPLCPTAKRSAYGVHVFGIVWPNPHHLGLRTTGLALMFLAATPGVVWTLYADDAAHRGQVLATSSDAAGVGAWIQFEQELDLVCLIVSSQTDSGAVFLAADCHPHDPSRLIWCPTS